MDKNNDSDIKVAEFLLQIKAVKLQPNEPFTWASGWKSPIYCDNRKILSFPKVRTYIRQQFAEKLLERFGKPDVIAGVATGGIAHGALVAEELGVPFIYVRSSAKKHGLQNKIEGVLEKGQRVVVIEDLISTGGSSLDAVDAIRETGGDVVGLLAVFSYGFDVAKENFLSKKCEYGTLTNYETLIDVASKDNYIESKDIESVKEWKKDPSSWKQ